LFTICPRSLCSTPFPYTTSSDLGAYTPRGGPKGRRSKGELERRDIRCDRCIFDGAITSRERPLRGPAPAGPASLLHSAVSGRSRDRKSTRLNSSHVKISYAVFCL